MKNGRYEDHGVVYWYNDDELHRLDGPAIEYPNGYKEWHVNALRHRLDGPAVEWDNGTKFWYVNGDLHRLDGPAREWANGETEWYVDGHEIDIVTILGYEPSVPLTEEEQMFVRLRV